MSRVLVTGATGFVGSVLCERLAQSGHVVRAALRSHGPVPPCVAESAVVGDINATTDWTRALQGVDCVVHAAARAHMLHDTPASSELYFETNALGTRNLGSAAASSGVRRFVFVSSIKVNGEGSERGAYRSADVPCPQDVYGRSKLEGERALLQAAGRAMECAIVRPPLIYGAGVRANFLRLMRWVDDERPLPLGAIHNRRSLVSVWNFADLVSSLLVSREAGGRAWLVSDDEDLSTPELIERLAAALGRRARLIRVPTSLLRVCATLAGRGAEFTRLCGSLTVDVSETRRVLNWNPPLGMDAALSRTAAWYRTLRR